MRSLEKELDTACRLARRAGDIALRYFGRGVAVETKADASPVTVADREAEQSIASGLAEAFPDDGLLGEEGASKAGRRRWIIDPIDGTREFVRGIPGWAVLLGLEAEDGMAVGVAHFPVTAETFFAARGAGAFLNGAPMHVSSIDTVSQAVLLVNGWNRIRRYPFAGHMLEWTEPFWEVLNSGGCMDAMMVARGQAELWIEPGGKPWDFAALEVIAEEAGARFFDFAGRRTIYGGNCVIAAPGLEIEARRLLAIGGEAAP